MKEQTRNRIVVITVLFGLLLMFFGGVPCISVSVRHEVIPGPPPDNNDTLEELQRVFPDWNEELQKQDSEKQKTESKATE